MPLSLAELRHRATTFAREYAATAHERSESQSFWRDFLDVFGQNRRRIARLRRLFSPLVLARGVRAWCRARRAGGLIGNGSILAVSAT